MVKSLKQLRSAVLHKPKKAAKAKKSKLLTLTAKSTIAQIAKVLKDSGMAPGKAKVKAARLSKELRRGE